MEQMSLFDDREVYNPLASSCARKTWTDLWDRSIFGKGEAAAPAH